MATFSDETLARVAKSPYCRGLPGFRGRGFRDRMRAAIAGDMDADTLASARHKVSESHVRMDAVSAALLAHHGANPAIVAIVALIASTAEVDVGLMRCVVTHRNAIVPADARGLMLWHSGRHSLNDVRLPDSVLGDLPGRALRDVVSHPALDALPLVISHLDARQSDEIVLEDVGDADLMVHLPSS